MSNQTINQICNRCVMDTTAADIKFDKDGNCNYCSDFLNLKRFYSFTPDEKKKIVRKFCKTNKNKKVKI